MNAIVVIVMNRNSVEKLRIHLIWIFEMLWACGVNTIILRSLAWMIVW